MTEVMRRLRYKAIMWLAGDDPVIVNMAFRGVTLHAEGGSGLVARTQFSDIGPGAAAIHIPNPDPSLRLAN